MPTACYLYQYSCLLLVLPRGPAGQGCEELKTIPACCIGNTGAGADGPGGLMWGHGPWTAGEGWEAGSKLGWKTGEDASMTGRP